MNYLSKLYAFAFVTLTSFAVNAEEISLRIGTAVPATSAQGEAISKFAEIVNGKNLGLDVKIFPGGQLGKAGVQVQNVKLGLQDGFFEDLGWMQSFSDDLRIQMAPFTFTGRDHLKRWLQSEAFQKVQSEIKQNGAQRYLVSDTIWWRGPYRVMLATKPVRNLEDVSGIKLRLPGLETMTKYWGKEGLGANTVNIPWGDVYLALRQGAADAVTSPFDLVVSMKFVEVAPHIMVTDEFPQIIGLAFNDNKWNSLSDTQKDAIMQGLSEAGAFFNGQVAANMESWKSQLQNAGGTFHDFDRDPFVSSVTEMHKKLEKEGYWRAGLIDEINSYR